MRCTATSKRSGEQCKNFAVHGRNVCAMHGGKSLSGSASPVLKTGRYSKSLPERLAARYEEAASDTEILSLREDVALLDARLAQLLGRVDTGESAEAWSKVQKALKSLQKAEAGGNPDKKREARFDLEDAIEHGGRDIEAWSEIADHLERRRKLAESERKRLMDMRQMVRADQAMTLVAAVVASVRRNVDDRRALANISADLTELVRRDAADGGARTFS